MGQIVGPWEYQEGRSLYLPHPQLRIAHPDHGKSSTEFSLCSHLYLFTFTYGCLVFLWVSKNNTILDSTIKPSVLRRYRSNFLCITLFLSVIPFYLLSLPLTRYTHTYLSTDFVVRQTLVFLFSLFFSRCLTDLVMLTDLHCWFHLCYLLYAKLCISCYPNMQHCYIAH